MRHAFGIPAILLCFALLQGCVTSSGVPDLPASLGEQGLLVARLYMPGSTVWQNAQINIDGRLHGSNLRDGYVAIALDPGEHNFSQLRIAGRQLSSAEPDGSPVRKVRGGGGAPIYYYSPGSTIYFTTLSVGRQFTIEAGKITNLGLIVYLPANDPAKQRAAVNESKEFYAFPLNNSTEISYYLETNFPALVATLKDRSPKLAPANYLDSAKLAQLRRFIAFEEGHGKKQIKSQGLLALYGDAGTIAVVKTGSDGKRNLEVFDTGTLANIVDAQSDGERLLFLTSEAKLLTLEQGKLTQTVVPHRIHPLHLSALGNNRLAIVDNHMRILISPDRGQTWSKYETAMIDEPRNDIGVVSDDKGAYVYLGNRGIPSSILHLQSDAPVPQVVSAPTYPPSAAPTGFNTVVAREAGLFVIFSDRDFYFFWSRANPHWERYSKPGVTCKGIGFDATGLELTVECDGATYESGNSGGTWSKTGGA